MITAGPSHSAYKAARKDFRDAARLIPVLIIYAVLQSLFYPEILPCKNPAVITEAHYRQMLKQAQTGDLVFRTGNGLFSKLVLLGDPGAQYSHVGLLVHKNHQPYVVHAVSEEALHGYSRVRIEHLRRFIAPENAGKIALARVHTSRKIREQAVRVALQYQKSALAYDLLFDLSSERALYCSELIWRAYKKQGLDLMEGHFDRLWILGNNRLIQPETLLQRGQIRQIASFPEK